MVSFDPMSIIARSIERLAAESRSVRWVGHGVGQPYVWVAFGREQHAHFADHDAVEVLGNGDGTRVRAFPSMQQKRRMDGASVRLV